MPLPPASRYFLTEGFRRLLCGRALRRRDGAREKRSRKMIRVSVEIREGVLTRRVRITAPSIEEALRIAGEGKPGRGIRLLFPVLQQLVLYKLLQNEAFFVPDGSEKREAA
jgi:hypothetical protein